MRGATAAAAAARADLRAGAAARRRRRGERGLGARLDRLERRLAIGAPAAEAPRAPGAALRRRRAGAAAPVRRTGGRRSAGAVRSAGGGHRRGRRPPTRPRPAARPSRRAERRRAAAGRDAALRLRRHLAGRPRDAGPAQAHDLDAAVPQTRRSPASTTASLTLAFTNVRAARAVRRPRASDEFVRQALIDVLGVDWRVEAIVDGPTGRSRRARPRRPAARDARAGECDASTDRLHRPAARVGRGSAGRRTAAADVPPARPRAAAGRRTPRRRARRSPTGRGAPACGRSTTQASTQRRAGRRPGSGPPSRREQATARVGRGRG